MGCRAPAEVVDTSLQVQGVDTGGTGPKLGSGDGPRSPLFRPAGSVVDRHLRPRFLALSFFSFAVPCSSGRQFAQLHILDRNDWPPWLDQMQPEITEVTEITYDP